MKTLCPTDPAFHDKDLSVFEKPVLGSLPPFGKQMRSAFALNPDCLFMNGASVGSLPKYVVESFEYYSRCSEYNPDKFLDYDMRPLFYATLERINPYVGCKDFSQLTFCPNGSNALNTVLRSLDFDKGDAIVRFSTTYGGCYNAISYVCDRTGATPVDIPINLPCSNQEILDGAKAAIERIACNPDLKLKFAVVDMISSIPGMVLPYKKLVEMLKEVGALVFLDGAHALGQIDINIDESDCDFFTTNTHKWFYSKRGSGLLYVAKKYHNIIQPLTISWAYKPSQGWNEAFFWQGTNDYSAYLSINAAIDFVEQAGGIQKIQSYGHNLAIEAGALLSELYGFEPISDALNEEQVGSMVNVKLPLQAGNPRHDKVGEILSQVLVTKKRSSGYAFRHNGAWWIRLCAMIYLEKEDFDEFGKLLTNTIDELLAES
ncbi:hypothetical protein BB560_006751 [Smittium megazygosporum]|uniref:Aminotransferase class V domain-containing protein n=1 Tax=Smittium megazygosporum TaxID=133381 RepID=A0A2T9Y204_9FUNG|nr:hypothetical protein BB560_006751 [Smittium megazygosporum]